MYGAEIMLDVGLYRLDQQVACQRYRQSINRCQEITQRRCDRGSERT